MKNRKIRGFFLFLRGKLSLQQFEAFFQVCPSIFLQFVMHFSGARTDYARSRIEKRIYVDRRDDICAITVCIYFKLSNCQQINFNNLKNFYFTVISQARYLLYRIENVNIITIFNRIYTILYKLEIIISYVF